MIFKNYFNSLVSTHKMSPLINEIAQCIDVPLMDCPNIASMIYDYVEYDMYNDEPDIPEYCIVIWGNGYDEEKYTMRFRNGELEICRTYYTTIDRSLEPIDGDITGVYYVAMEHPKELKEYTPMDDPYTFLYELLLDPDSKEKTIEVFQWNFKKDKYGFCRGYGIVNALYLGDFPYMKEDRKKGLAIHIYENFFKDIKKWLETATEEQAQQLL